MTATLQSSFTWESVAKSLPGLAEVMYEWLRDDKTRRLWSQDASLWTGADEAHWLGWLTVAQDQLADLDGLFRGVEDIEEEGFRHILLLGMGGSSLCPEV